ncbi:MAG: hypothetical protein ABIX01_12710 [Chitinophagaceae bacterium]
MNVGCLNSVDILSILVYLEMEYESIPEETVIYFSKTFAVFETLGGFAGLFFAFISYFYDHLATFIGILLLAGALLFIYTGIKRFFNRAPQITINTKGIATAKTAFKAWPQISNEKVCYRYTGNKGIYFMYDFEDGSENIRINALKISFEKMKMLVKTYRERSLLMHNHMYTIYREHKALAVEKPNPLYDIDPTYKKYITTKK